MTETWFTADKPASCYNLPNFHLFHRDRIAQRGGGVALYIRDDINSRVVFEEHVPAHLEILWVKLTSSANVRLKSTIYVGVVYAPPRSPYQNDIIDHIIRINDVINSTDNAAILVLGDFNDLRTEIIEQHTLMTQLVNQPTRDNAILDKILTSIPEHFCEPIVSAPISSGDHRVVIVHPHELIQSDRSPDVKFRPFRDSSVRSFGQWITVHQWEELCNLDDPDNEVNVLLDTLMSKYRQCFPEITVKRKSRDKPWLNNIIRQSIIKRDAAYKQGSMDTYRKLRNKVQRNIKYAKSSYYKNKIECLKHSEPGKWHRQIRSLVGFTKQPLKFSSEKSPQQVADDLNSYFTGICTQLPLLNLSTLPAYLPAPLSPPCDPG